MWDSATSCRKLGLTYFYIEHKWTGFTWCLRFLSPGCVLCQIQLNRAWSQCLQQHREITVAVRQIPYFTTFINIVVSLFASFGTQKLFKLVFGFYDSDLLLTLQTGTRVLHTILTASRHLSRKLKATTTRPSRVSPHLGISCFHRC